MPFRKPIPQALCLAILLTWFAPTSKAEDPYGFVLAPLHTELQRQNISSEASAMLVLNGNLLTVHSLGDAPGLDLEEMKSGLQRLAKRDPKLLLVRLQINLDSKPSKPHAESLKNEMIQIATEAGFEKTKVAEVFTSVRWSDDTDETVTGFLDDMQEENIIKNRVLTAAPVRTRLSKLLFSSSDAWVSLRQPLDTKNCELSDSTQRSIRDAIHSMKLDNPKLLLFYVNCSDEVTDIAQKLFSNQKPPAIPENASPAIKELLQEERDRFEISPALRLAQELGFQSVGLSYSPNSGRSEKLVGKAVPAFELSDLDGQPVRWPEWQGNRVGLITFWGVACGPCVREAPHLSRMHEKYGDKIAILGVNAYEESNETIREFVESANIKHQIVTGGQDLASETFGVSSYPTTYWINRKGEVVRYQIGFDDGELLEEDLVAFLKEEE